ncbi:hypothetical protein SAMN05192559_101333 [Halobacillus karajensis]|nr:hypothetical protein SAMN05192559_101333 [Halobacillus karajensis]
MLPLFVFCLKDTTARKITIKKDGAGRTFVSWCPGFMQLGDPFRPIEFNVDGGTLIGGILFGVGPITVSLYTVTEKRP